MSEQLTDNNDNMGDSAPDGWDSLANIPLASAPEFGPESTVKTQSYDIAEPLPDHEIKRSWSDALAEVKKEEDALVDEAVRESIAQFICLNQQQAISDKAQEAAKSYDSSQKRGVVGLFLRNHGIREVDLPSPDDVDAPTLAMMIEEQLWRSYRENHLDEAVNGVFNKMSPESLERSCRQHRVAILTGLRQMKG